MPLAALAARTRHNLDTLRRQPLAELSGALGDLGTLLPLTIALALQRSINLAATLVLTGLFNILTGALFAMPLPVQPMKAIAAAALAATPPPSAATVAAAGALVSAAVGLLAASGALRRLAPRIPVPVVRGIQLGAGLQLAVSAGAGGGMLAALRWTRPPLDNRLWAAAAFALLVAAPRRFPYALAVFAVGLGLAACATQQQHSPDNNPSDSSSSVWRATVPAFRDPAAWAMALAQLPLTTLNSVVAAAALAAELDGGAAGRAPGVTQLGLSVAGMNLAGCWAGAMPVCHGAGGLAAQWRFGARSGASVVVLGAVKVVLGLAVLGARGGGGWRLLEGFPRALLGVMVVAAGLELARVGGQSLNHGAADLWEEEEGEGEGGRRHRHVSDEERAERWTVMMVTAVGILAFKNDAVGFVAGLLTHGAYRLRRRGGGGGAGAGERRPLLRGP